MSPEKATGADFCFADDDGYIRVCQLSARQLKALPRFLERFETLMKYLRQDATEAIENGSWTRARDLVRELEETVEIMCVAEEVASTLEDAHS